MKKAFIILVALSTFLAFSHAQAGDVEAVKSILAKNNSELNINEIAKFRGGRIIELNLDNKDFGKEGITTLPSEIGKLTGLLILTLNDNDLTLLPEEIYNLTKLIKLEIRNNNLVSLASNIRKLTKLRELDLRNNEIKELPREIGRLKSLVKLQLWGNELKTLPSTIGNLSSLKELYLRENRLTSLPVSITRLRPTYLDILDNYLCNVPGKIIRWLKKYDKNYKSLQFCNGNFRFYRFRSSSNRNKL